MKRCPRCGETLPLTDFHINRASKDGRNWCCRGCKHIYNVCRVDEMAVERAVMGDPPAWLNLAERRAVIEQLVRRGLPTALIATRARVCQETVRRHRARMRAAA